MIVDAAISFFADVGFAGQTRELARRIGVTQSLLFRYFPTKDALIERVYRDVYLDRWKPYWEIVLKDRSIPLAARITNFYTDYMHTIADYEWIRIFMFAGLLNNNIGNKYGSLFRDRIIVPMCHEIRHELGLKMLPEGKLTIEELQICWALNGAIASLAWREFIFDMPTSSHHDTIIPALVTSFLEGAPTAFKKISDRQLKRGAIPASGDIQRPRSVSKGKSNKA